jgi:phosphoglycerate kinase
VACAGPLLAAELEALGKALQNPKRPLVAIVGGAKVSTKLTILAQLAQKVDQLIVGGGITNTFMLAAGMKIGKSLCEPDLVEEAKRVMAQIKAQGGHVPPVDVVVAKEFSCHASAATKDVSQVTDDDLILDIGPKSAAVLTELLKRAATIVWNGPVGVFEYDQLREVLAPLRSDCLLLCVFAGGGGETVPRWRIRRHRQDLATSPRTGAFHEFLEGQETTGCRNPRQRAAGNALKPRNEAQKL